MSDQIVATQYGPLGRIPALAVQLVISTTGSNAIIALNTAHLTLGLRPNRTANIPPPETPADRWRRLMIWLFGSLADTGATSRHFSEPPAVTAAEERTVDKILGAAGAFLLAESRKLDDQIETWRAVEFGDEVPEREIAEIASMREHVIVADNAGQQLLRMVGSGTWGEALCPKASTTVQPEAAESPRAEAAEPHEVQVFFSMPYGTRDSLAGEVDWSRAMQDTLDHMRHEASKTLILVVDVTSSFAHIAADRAIAWAERLRALHGVSPEMAPRELVVTAVDGRQTNPIALEYGPRGLRAECRNAFLAAVEATSLADRFGGEKPPLGEKEGASLFLDAADLRGRTEDLAAALAFVMDTAEPDQILVVSDLPMPTDLGSDAIDELFASSSELVEHRKRLQDRSLSFSGVLLTVASTGKPVPLMLWKALCGRDARLLQLPEQGQYLNTHDGSSRRNAITTMRKPRRSGRRRGPCPPEVTVLVNVDQKPPQRVLATASVLLVSVALVLALAGAGVGFFLADSGPGLPVTFAALVGLGASTAGLGLMWAGRTKSVTALRSVTSAAVRVSNRDLATTVNMAKTKVSTGR